MKTAVALAALLALSLAPARAQSPSDLQGFAPVSVSFDLPGAHVALIRYDLAACLTRYGRLCAASLVQSATERAEWDLVAAECATLGQPRGYGRAVMERACELMAMGRAVAATELLAGECGLSVDDWAAETRREMSVSAGRVSL